MKNKVLEKIYIELENEFPVIEKEKYKSLVNFSTSKINPIHRWFYIKEGYSKNLIIDLINRFKIKNNEYILDPFCGSGTTLLTCKFENYNSIGFEVNPFLAKLTKVKTENYDHRDIELILKELDLILNKKFKYNTLKIPKLSISEKLFKEQFDDVIKIRSHILEIENNKVKDFLLISFLSILESISYCKKDGNGLKYPKNKIPLNIYNTFKIKVNEMIKDVEKNKSENKPFIFNIDSRKLYDILNGKIINSKFDLNNNKNLNDLKDFKKKVSLVVFSPPYMNCFDYTEVYKVELWFGDFIREYSDLKILRNNSLSSHLNCSLKKRNILKNKYVLEFINKISEGDIWSKKIPLMIENYFEDMYLVLKFIFDILKDNGKCVIIVGNSAYNSIAIPTDSILANISKEIGFSKCKIEVARHLGTSSQQYKTINKKKILRESLVILEK